MKKKRVLTLDQVLPATNVVVKKIVGEGNIRRRLFDMGITPNIEIYMRKVAPLKDPIEIKIRDYELSLRKSEASLIEVE